jgi:hypothetical protein
MLAYQIADGRYLRLLDDVYYATHKKGGEVLFLYSSDQFSTQGEHEAEIRIRNAGGARPLDYPPPCEGSPPASAYDRITHLHPQ